MATGGALGGNGVITTTDENDASLVQAAVPENSAATIQIMVCARRVSDGKTKSWLLTLAVKRASGDVEISNAITHHAAGDPGTSPWAVSAVPNADNVNIVVSGQAGSEIDWAASILGASVSH